LQPPSTSPRINSWRSCAKYLPADLTASLILSGQLTQTGRDGRHAKCSITRNKVRPSSTPKLALLFAGFKDNCLGTRIDPAQFTLYSGSLAHLTGLAEVAQQG
jgi:hypothetical protein